MGFKLIQQALHSYSRSRLKKKALVLVNIQVLVLFSDLIIRLEMPDKHKRNYRSKSSN